MRQQKKFTKAIRMEIIKQLRLKFINKHLNFSEAQGVVLHKDSKWSQSWNNFKENNAYVNSKSSLFKLDFDSNFNFNFRIV